VTTSSSLCPKAKEIRSIHALRVPALPQLSYAGYTWCFSTPSQCGTGHHLPVVHIRWTPNLKDEVTLLHLQKCFFIIEIPIIEILERIFIIS
jgi:hypothetical protein